MTDNKERDAFEAWLSKHPDRGDFTSHEKDYMADAWQARAALAASQEKAEPVAYVDGDDSLRRILWEPDQAAFNLPVGTKLYAAPVAAQEKAEPVTVLSISAKLADLLHLLEPSIHVGTPMPEGDRAIASRLVLDLKQALPLAAPVAAQASEPVAWGAFHFGGKRDGKLYTTADTKEAIEAYIANLHQSNDSITLRAAPLYNAPQPSSGAVRDAALEEAADAAMKAPITAGMPDDNSAQALAFHASARIRALKSAPPQPAEQPDEYMCPNCVTPWKCNGPHILTAEQPSTSPAALEAELIAALRWAIDEAHAQKLAGIAGPLSRILARAQGERPAPGAQEGA